jgi:acyl-CoA synthetase (AMP-forming)/AMP-acid ligase II
LGSNLTELFEFVADAVPERTALVRGEQRRSFAQLQRRANQCAKALLARGVGAGDGVGLHLGDCAESVEAVLACIKLGAVPIELLRCDDPDTAHTRLDAAVAAIHHRSDASRFAALRDRLPRLRTLLSVDDGSGTDLSAAGSEDYESALAGAADSLTWGRS